MDLVDGDVGRLASVRVLVSVLHSAFALGGCTSAAAKLEAENQALLTTAQTSAAALLREPASATFSNVTIGEVGAGNDYVCGEVNGRNAFGGYGNKTRFTYNRYGTKATIQPEENEFPGLREEVSRLSFCVFDQEYRQCKGESFAELAFVACSPFLAD